MKHMMIAFITVGLLLAGCCNTSKTQPTVQEKPTTNPVLELVQIGQEQAEFIHAYVQPQVNGAVELALTPVRAAQNILLGGVQFAFTLADGTKQFVSKKIVPSVLPMVGDVDVYQIEKNPAEVTTPLQAVLATADTMGALKLINQASKPLKVFYDALPGELRGTTYKIAKIGGVVTAVEIAGMVIQQGDMAVGEAIFTVRKAGDKIITEIKQPQSE